MTTPEPSFDDLCGTLPDHATEVMTAHGYQPGTAEQDRTHGAGVPAVDNGPTVGPRKYGGAI